MLLPMAVREAWLPALSAAYCAPQLGHAEIDEAVPAAPPLTLAFAYSMDRKVSAVSPDWETNTQL
jgi:hypothetical protein